MLAVLLEMLALLPVRAARAAAAAAAAAASLRTLPSKSPAGLAAGEVPKGMKRKGKALLPGVQLVGVLKPVLAVPPPHSSPLL
jgi:hypothetical protein